MSTPFVAWFDQADPAPHRLGGKGSSLCRLVQSRYRVPPGFVIPTDAFFHTCEALGLGPLLAAVTAALQGNGDLASAGELVKTRLLNGRIPDSVLHAISSAVTQLDLWRDNPHGVLVRSSATVEDSAAHSFAGIFESIPVTAPDQLEPTIREVWASVFSPRALTYCREVGLKEFPGMAVVIQRFIDAERSGVMFTRFDGRTLVEHVEGGCEKLVKGEVTPEQLWIPGPGKEPGDSGLLPAEHAWELSRLAESLEENFGGPQDVEWVLFQGAVHVVQSRPITTGVTRSGGEPKDAVSGTPPILKGIPASGGWGSGPVHLAFNIEDALALETGQVLVTPMTNPDMVVAMRKSAAIVTDVGGMICHAAIVSRELGLPCVVGTAAATTTLKTGDVITVSGTAGAVYRGTLQWSQPTERPCEWSDLWARWTSATTDRQGLIAALSSSDGIEAIPAGIDTIVLIPDVDLRCSDTGLWVDLEAMSQEERDGVLHNYFSRVAELARARRVDRVYIQPHDTRLSRLIGAAVRKVGSPLSDPDTSLPRGLTAFSLGSAALQGAQRSRPPLPEMAAAETVALDTLKFFGHVPASRRAPMPSLESRQAWWRLLPEYGRYHREFQTEAESREHTWLEVRPELVISALLKSLVQPGFETVPRFMGFPALPPMHVKWIKCRYHFRSDSFTQVWQAIVRGTWNPEYMADLLRRTRISYERLRQVLTMFPRTDEELATIAPERMVTVITSWWPRWVEFFALCWFQQAQGDDIVYPFIEETVNDHLARLPKQDFAWPQAAELIAPTTPVMSGDYMASVGRLRKELLAAGLGSKEAALAALDRGEHPDLSRLLTDHLKQWHWMRDRDLLFEPWDQPGRVIETALKTDPHAPADYQANLRRNRLALSFHFDLAQGSGRAAGLNHAARFLHDLNVERENHHVLWLKYSYPLRRLVLEIERRLIALGSLAQGDIFFMQAPELIEAARRLPEPLPADLVRRVKNRRLGYLYEARLAKVDPEGLVREDDYY